MSDIQQSLIDSISSTPSSIIDALDWICYSEHGYAGIGVNQKPLLVAWKECPKTIPFFFGANTSVVPVAAGTAIDLAAANDFAGVIWLDQNNVAMHFITLAPKQHP